MIKYLFLIILYTLPLFSQQQVIKLWNAKVPGSITNESYKEKTDTVDNKIRVYQVTEPTLTYYPAPKDKYKGAAVVICPGGAYRRLAVDSEGDKVAEWFASIGVSAFILKYRLPGDLIMEDKTIGPLQDGQEAIRILRRNALLWNIKPDKIGVIGFSAGGHLASTISTHYKDKIYNSDLVSARPDYSILIYPVISMDSTISHIGSMKNLLGENPLKELIDKFSNDKQVNENTPPTFLVHSMDDKTVPVQNSINYFLSLKKYNVPSELHIFETGGHGYGLGKTNNTETSWTELCRSWLVQHGFIESK